MTNIIYIVAMKFRKSSYFLICFSGIIRWMTNELPNRLIYSSPSTRNEEALGLRAWEGHPEGMPTSHRHNDLEMNLVERGEVTYFFGGRRILLQPGTLVLFWAITPHQLTQCTPVTQMYWLTLPLTWFLHCRWPEPFKRAVLNCDLVYDHAPRPQDRLQSFQWQSDLGRGTLADRDIVLLEVEARLKRMAQQVGSPNQPPPASPHDQSQAEKMAAFLAGSFLEPVTVEDAARAAGLHPNYAMRVFRRAYGQTIIEYLTQVRVAYAQTLLVTTDQKVVDIALRSGFGSVSQFYTAFQRVCGLTPRQYRASLR